MVRSIVINVLLLLSNLHRTLAFESIDAPSFINCSDELKIAINNDLDKGAQSYDREFDSFRVCSLISNATMGTRGVGGKLPIDIGQDGAYYAIAAQPFNQDPNNRTVSNSSVGIVQYSKPFSVAGTNGTFAQYELDGRSPGWAEFISCSAYSCVRECYSRSYPGDWTDDPCAGAPHVAYDCFAECPNTDIPNWPDEIVSLYGADCSHLSFLPMPTQTVTGSATTITIHQSATGSQGTTGFSTKSDGQVMQTGSSTAKKSLATANTIDSRSIWALLGIGTLAMVV